MLSGPSWARNSVRRRLRTLGLLCRTLRRAVEVRENTSIADRVQEDEWSEMIALADELWVAPSLWSAVRDERDAVPAAAAEQLRDRHRANAVRNARFRRRLLEAVAALNAHDVEPLLFKGALLLVDGTPGALGEHCMADLDLAVPAAARDASERALREIGYVSIPEKPFMHVHEVALAHHRSPGPLELHVELGTDPLPSLLPSADVWTASTEIVVGDGRARALCPTHQVLHNVVHSAVQDFNHAVAGLPLRQLLSLARLEQRHRENIDWAGVAARMQQASLTRTFRDHLWLAHRLVGLPLPDGLNGDARSNLHEAKVLASFGLGWPPELRRNLRLAFGREYLNFLYGHRNDPYQLARARVTHGVHLLRRDGRRVSRDALRRRI